MRSTAIHPKQFPWFDYSRYSFSLGLRTPQGGAYLSGHTASEFDPQAKKVVVRGSMTDQCRTAYSKIGAILEGAGLGFADVVRVVEYLRPEGIERYAEAAQVRAEVFGSHQPTVNTVPVTSLLRPGAFIELEITAAPPGALARAGRSPASESAGLVFLPSLLPIDAQGQVIAPGDVVGQLQAIFDKAASLLSPMGLSLNQVVKTVDYLTPQAVDAYRQTAGVRRQRLGPVFPAATGIIMPRLIDPRTLIQIDLIASRDRLQCVNPGWQHYDTLTYSPAVRAGKMLFISGHGAVDPANGVLQHADDVVAQSAYTFGLLKQILHCAGGDLGNLVKTIEYIPSSALERYRDVGGVRTRLLPQPYPAATGLVCEALLKSNMKIEIDATALLED